MRPPDYSGGSLVNLVAHIERCHTGTSPTPGLTSTLADAVPHSAPSTVLVLIDGLGFDMVEPHSVASPLRAALRGRLDASFSTQTSVATATLATALPPAQHGLLGYLLDLPEVGGVVNTLWWMRTDGGETDLDLSRFLPTPNLAERLAGHGTRVVVVEPEGYLGSPLDAVLYRGAATRGVTESDLMATVVTEASEPATVVVVYLPAVDAAGHLEGPGSEAHRGAIEQVGTIWASMAAALPAEVRMVGTADHGMVTARTWIDVEAPDGVRLGGDSRVLFIYGEPDGAGALAGSLPGTVMDARSAPELWGPSPRHPRFEERLPRFLVFAPPGVVFHHEGNPTRMIGYHGGLTPHELEIPLLVR